MVATVLAASTVAAVGPARAAAATDSYRALVPARVLDTRNGIGASGRVGAGQAITLDVTGVGGVPTSGVAAVVLNVTATNATQGTFVTVWPSGQTQPNTSNLNVQPGVDTPNAVIATVGADGTIQLANEFGQVDLLADVSGWIPTGADYTALTPERILDTRVNRAANGPLGTEAAISVTVTGVGGVPATGVSAVVLNVTAVEATEPTYVSVWPAGQPQPNTSNLNVRPGVDTPNLVIATVGEGGAVQLANQFGSLNLIADVSGYFTGGTGYQALTPGRVLDTRQNVGATGPVPAEGSIDVQVAGLAGVPASGVSAVVLNVTATGATASTYVTVWPAGHPRPDASSLNVQPGADTPNLVIATVGDGGRVSLANQFGSTHLIADVAGYFVGTPPPNPSRPGSLWAGGAGDIFRYDLADPTGGWTERGTFDDAFTIGPNRREIIDISSNPVDPTVVTVRDLDTSTVKESFVWNTSAWGANDLEVSPDELSLAAVLTQDSLTTWVEILNRTDRSTVYLGLDGIVNDVEFAPNGDLIVAIDRSDEESPPHHAAIGRIPKAALGAPVVSYQAIAVFDAAHGVPSSLAVSRDGAQVLFAAAGGLWVASTADDGSTPHQLTTGPNAHVGGAFAPDASRIAFRLVSPAAGFQRQYIVPNHRGAPIAIDPLDGTGDEYLVGRENLITHIAAWIG